ncbi:hypothetical protein M3J09_007671 [Ascochyta lentis]
MTSNTHNDSASPVAHLNLFRSFQLPNFLRSATEAHTDVTALGYVSHVSYESGSGCQLRHSRHDGTHRYPAPQFPFA